MTGVFCQYCGQFNPNGTLAGYYRCLKCGKHMWEDKNNLPQKYKHISTISKKKLLILPEMITGKNTCAILETHHTALKGDPERLSTDFMKRIINNHKDPCPEVTE
jgi:hypothetical protein